MSDSVPVNEQATDVWTSDSDPSVPAEPVNQGLPSEEVFPETTENPEVVPSVEAEVPDQLPRDADTLDQLRRGVLPPDQVRSIMDQLRLEYPLTFGAAAQGPSSEEPVPGPSDNPGSTMFPVQPEDAPAQQVNASEEPTVGDEPMGPSSEVAPSAEDSRNSSSFWTDETNKLVEELFETQVDEPATSGSSLTPGVPCLVPRPLDSSEGASGTSDSPRASPPLAATQVSVEPRVVSVQSRVLLGTAPSFFS